MVERRLSIVYVVPTFARTGVTNVLLGLVQGMISNNNNVVVVALNDFDVSDSVQVELQNTGAKIHVLQGSYMHKVNELRKIVSLEKANIVHSHAMKADLFVSIAINGVKKVSTAHNIAKQDFTAVYGRFRGTLMALLQKNLYKYRFNAVYAVSKTVSDYWRKNGVETFVVYNGFGNLGQNPEVKRQIKFEYPVHFVWTGRISKRKRLGVLLEWIKGNENYSITIVGNGALYDHLKQEYHDYSNIVFVGRVQDVLPYLLSDSIFVSASSSEGLPMAAIEAMKNNLPLLLSDIPQHRELSDSNFFGVQFFSDKEGFFKGVQNLVESNNQVETEKIYVEKFTLERMTANYLKQYEYLISRRK